MTYDHNRIRREFHGVFRMNFNKIPWKSVDTTFFEKSIDNDQSQSLSFENRKMENEK